MCTNSSKQGTDSKLTEFQIDAIFALWNNGDGEDVGRIAWILDLNEDDVEDVLLSLVQAIELGGITEAGARRMVRDIRARTMPLL